MRLWHITAINETIDGFNPWLPWYDKAYGFVIAAETGQRARELAAENCGDEGGDPWLDSKYSICESLDTVREEGCLIRDYAQA